MVDISTQEIVEAGRSSINMKRWRPILRGYFEETTVHGFKYVVSANSLVERIFWTAAIVAVLTVSGYLIQSSLRETANNPISTSIETVPVQEVHFPAITIGAGAPTRPYGLMGHIMDYSCFDETYVRTCANDENVAKFRQDLSPYLANVAGFTYEMMKIFLFEPSQLEFALTVFWGFKDVNGALDFFKGLPSSTADQCLFALMYNAEYDYHYVNRSISEFRRFALSFGARDLEVMALLDLEVDTTRQAPLPDACSEVNVTLTYYHQESGEELQVPFSGAYFLSAFALSHGKYSDKLPLGMLFNVTYPHVEDYRYYGQQVEPAFYKISRLIMDSDELNILDMANLLDSRALNGRGQSHNMIGGLHSCSMLGFNVTLEECRDLMSEVGERFEAVLHIMKWTLQPQSATVPRFEFELDFGHKLEDLEYVSERAKPYIYLTYPLLVSCDHGASFPIDPFKYGYGDHECVGFSRSFTTAGLGYTFNAAHFWETYRETPGLRAFFNAMHPKGNAKVHDHVMEKSEQRHDWFRPLWDEVIYPAAAGPKYGKAIYLVSDSPANGPFKVFIHHPSEPADLEANPIEFIPGMKHTVYITPSRSSSHSELEDFPLETRKCLFPHERAGASNLFRNYTKGGCQFECAVNKAHARCGCIPWDYPHVEEPLQVCQRIGDECFRNTMASAQIYKDCDCPVSCSSTTYSFSVISTPLDASECYSVLSYKTRRNNRLFLDAFEFYMEHYEDRHFELNKKYADLPSMFKFIASCGEAEISEIALLQFQLTSDTVAEVVRRKRVTFTDQLASLGTT